MTAFMFSAIAMIISVIVVGHEKDILTNIISNQSSQLSVYRKTTKQQNKIILTLRNKKCSVAPVFDKSLHLTSQEDSTTYGTGY